MPESTEPTDQTEPSDSDESSSEQKCSACSESIGPEATTCWSCNSQQPDPQGPDQLPLKKKRKRKKCYSCAELIQPEAKICRYCNRKQPDLPCPKCGALNFQFRSKCLDCRGLLRKTRWIDVLALSFSVPYTIFVGFMSVVSSGQMLYNAPLHALPAIYFIARVILDTKGLRTPRWASYVVVFMTLGLASNAVNDANNLKSPSAQKAINTAVQEREVEVPRRASLQSQKPDENPYQAFAPVTKEPIQFVMVEASKILFPEVYTDPTNTRPFPMSDLTVDSTHLRGRTIELNLTNKSKTLGVCAIQLELEYIDSRNDLLSTGRLLIFSRDKASPNSLCVGLPPGESRTVKTEVDVPTGTKWLRPSVTEVRAPKR